MMDWVPLDANKRPPAALRDLPNWVVWVEEARNGKRTKPPRQITREYAEVNNPRTWATLEAARAVRRGHMAWGSSWMGRDGSWGWMWTCHGTAPKPLRSSAGSLAPTASGPPMGAAPGMVSWGVAGRMPPWEG